MTLQTQIDFSVHRNERTKETTRFVQDNAKKLSGNCKKLVKFWQEKHYWLSSDSCLQLAGVRNVTQRCADLIHINKIPVEIMMSENKQYKLYRLKCTCHHVHGELQNDGCWLHSEKLKV